MGFGNHLAQDLERFTPSERFYFWCCSISIKLSLYFNYKKSNLRNSKTILCYDSSCHLWAILFTRLPNLDILPSLSSQGCGLRWHFGIAPVEVPSAWIYDSMLKEPHASGIFCYLFYYYYFFPLSFLAQTLEIISTAVCFCFSLPEDVCVLCELENAKEHKLAQYWLWQIRLWRSHLQKYLTVLVPTENKRMNYTASE